MVVSYNFTNLFTGNFQKLLCNIDDSYFSLSNNLFNSVLFFYDFCAQSNLDYFILGLFDDFADFFFKLYFKFF